MKGNPAVPGGSLTSKPTWSNTLGCSATSAFFVSLAFGSGDLFMASHLQLGARLALGAALALAGLGFLIAMVGLSLYPLGDADNVRLLPTLDVLSQIAAVLAILANLLAFFMALGCWLKGTGKVPWVV